MGGAKRMMEEHEATLAHVLGLLEEAGAVERCEIHDYVVDREDPGAAEEVIEQLADEHGRDEAEELVESALAEAAEECPGCAANRDRD
jgi:hypothetical protein